MTGIKRKAPADQAGGNVEFESIKRQISVAQVIAFLGLDGKQQGKEFSARNPKRNDHALGSFKINLESGKWSDFATGDKGGDVISLVAYLCTDGDQLAASKILVEHFGLAGVLGVGSVCNRAKPDMAPVSLPLASNTTQADAVIEVFDYASASERARNAGAPPTVHPKWGKPAAIYAYKSPDGTPILYVWRFERGSKKTFLPLSVSIEGPAQWEWQNHYRPRPIFNLHLLTADLLAPVVVCEGEKAAEAASRIMPGFVATTSPNGSNSAHLADWSMLGGRDVVIWADNDAPGADYARKVAAEIQGAKSICMVNNAQFTDTSERALPSGFDAADAEARGFDALKIADLMECESFYLPISAPPESAEAKGSNIHQSFHVSSNGVFYKSDEDDQPTFICSELRVTALVRDTNDAHWGRLLEFKDPSGVLHKWSMPMEMLRGSGEEYRGHLLSMGLQISTTSKARNYLSSYIQSCRPTQIVRCVSKTGWCADSFVLPNVTIGASNEKPIFQTDEPVDDHFLAKGSLDEWRANVASECVGNSRLVLAICVMLGSPLLSIVNEEGGGFNLRGQSSIGKTTALKVAASVWGSPDFVRTWRTTSNGLESVAFRHSDIGLILDEMSQVDPNEAGNIAYMLVNGQSKQRANRMGGARPVAKWLLNFLSSSEIALAQHIGTVGRKATAGQEIRIVDLPADTESGNGIFENLHNADSANEFARNLSNASARHHGVAGRAFLERLVAEGINVVQRKIESYRRSFMEALNLPANAVGQVKRVANKFALIATAGELATEYGITGWQDGESINAAVRCFEAWIQTRNGYASAEERALLKQVKLFFEQHGDSRFIHLNLFGDRLNEARVISNRAGFTQEQHNNPPEYYVLKEVFENEIISGFDRKVAIQVLRAHGWLVPDANNKSTTSKHVPGAGQARVYRFSAKVFQD